MVGHTASCGMLVSAIDRIHASRCNLEKVKLTRCDTINDLVDAMQTAVITLSNLFRWNLLRYKKPKRTTTTTRMRQDRDPAGRNP